MRQNEHQHVNKEYNDFVRFANKFKFFPDRIKVFPNVWPLNRRMFSKLSLNPKVFVILLFTTARLYFDVKKHIKTKPQCLAVLLFGCIMSSDIKILEKRSFLTEYCFIYTVEALWADTCRRTALLTGGTKPRLNSSSYILCIYTFP